MIQTPAHQRFRLSRRQLIVLGIIALLLFVSLAKAQHSVSTPGLVWSYSHVSAQGTQTIKQVAGTLHSVVVNSSAVAPCSATLYDSIGSSATIIGVIDCSNTFPRTYDVAFATGLTISVNANPSPDLTVMYQ